MAKDVLWYVNEAKALVESPEISVSAYTTETDASIPISRWVRWLNQSQQYIQNIMVMRFEEYLGKQSTITFTADQDTYSIPGDSIQVRLIERTDTTPYFNLYPLDLQKRNIYQDFNQLYPADYLNWYTFWGKDILITPTPETSGVVANVWYIRRMPDLHYGQADSANATSIVFPSSTLYGDISNEDDYYNGARVKIVSATTGAGQISEITDYVGSTRTATVSWTAPTGTVVYSLLSDIPDEYAELLVTRTAITATLKDKDTSAFNLLGNRYNEVEKQAIENLSNRQTQESNSVNYVTDPYYDY